MNKSAAQIATEVLIKVAAEEEKKPLSMVPGITGGAIGGTVVGGGSMLGRMYTRQSLLDAFKHLGLIPGPPPVEETMSRLGVLKRILSGKSMYGRLAIPKILGTAGLGAGLGVGLGALGTKTIDKQIQFMANKDEYD